MARPMSGYGPVLYSVDEPSGVAHVLLNRPDAANALSSQLVDALATHLVSFDRTVRVVVISGSGANFCGGFDVKEDGHLAQRMRQIDGLLTALGSVPAITIALAQGNVVGAGADIVSHCDIRLAYDDARFSFPGLRKFGVVLGTARLSQLVGVKVAVDLAVGGAVLDVASAVRVGLIDSIVDCRETAVAAVSNWGETLSSLDDRSFLTFLHALRAAHARSPDATADLIGSLGRVGRFKTGSSAGN